MSSRGQHAAADGSFQRSAGGAMARGIVLIAVAVLIGVVLLRSTDRTPISVDTSGGGKSSATTQPAASGSSTTTTTAATAHDPSKVKVLVANGARVQGAAAKVADSLRSSNYVLKQSVNTKTGVVVEESVVYYGPGYEPDAKKVAALLTPQPAVQALPATLPVTDLADANVLVVIAADLAAGQR